MVSSKGSKKQSKEVPAASPVTPSKWVVVQLTPAGEREKNINQIIRAVHQILKRKDLEVFVPAISQKGQNDALTTWYSDGYIFIKYVDGVTFNSLQETNYFSMVLSKPTFVNGVRKNSYSLLEDKDLDPMRVGMKVMKVGGFSERDKVKVVKGNYKNLPGRVSIVYEGGETVQICMEFRSKPLFMDFPASYLEKIEDV